MIRIVCTRATDLEGQKPLSALTNRMSWNTSRYMKRRYISGANKPLIHSPTDSATAQLLPYFIKVTLIDVMLVHSFVVKAIYH